MNTNLSFDLTFTVDGQEINLTIDLSLYTDDGGFPPISIIESC